MSIYTQWVDADQTAIYQVFDRTWTGSEFDAQYHQIEAWVGSVEHDVNLIVELNDIDLNTPVIDAIQRDDFPRKLQSIIVVDKSHTVTKHLMALIKRITPPTKKAPIVIVSDLDQAYEVLHLQQALA